MKSDFGANFYQRKIEKELKLRHTSLRNSYEV